jgi:hypothetical protein
MHHPHPWAHPRGLIDVGKQTAWDVQPRSVDSKDPTTRRKYLSHCELALASSTLLNDRWAITTQPYEGFTCLARGALFAELCPAGVE